MKTNELTGAALDLAVAQIEGCTARGFSPSTNRRQAGPIIEREGIHWISNGRNDRAGKPYKWMATKNFSDPLGNFYGPTPLIAAMRCYVASKLGGEFPA